MGFSQDRDQLIKTPAHFGDVGKYANISNLLLLVGSELKLKKKETYSVFGGVKISAKSFMGVLVGEAGIKIGGAYLITH